MMEEFNEPMVIVPRDPPRLKLAAEDRRICVPGESFKIKVEPDAFRVEDTYGW